MDKTPVRTAHLPFPGGTTLIRCGHALLFALSCVVGFAQTPTCTGISPYVANPVSPGGSVTYTVSGVQNATSVAFIVQSQSQTIGSAPSYPGAQVDASTWQYTVNTTSLSVGGYKVTPNLIGSGSSAYCSQTGFFTVVTTMPANPTRTYCNWYAGTWTEYSSPTTQNATWTLTQDTSGNVTGSVSSSYPGCSPTTWTVAGWFDPTNPPSVVSLTASNPNPAGNGTCTAALSVTEQVSIRQPYCSMGAANWQSHFADSTKNSSGNDSWAKSPADVPPGEVTLFNTFGGQWGYGTEGAFAAALSGATLFGGRTVSEMQSGAGVDNCVFPGAAVSAQTTLTGGVWAIQTYVNNFYNPNTNFYYNDWIGFAPGKVAYYQKYRPMNGLSLPCTVTINQQMVIGTATPNQYVSYGGQNSGNVNPLVITIDSNLVKASRAGVELSTPFLFQ